MSRVTPPSSATLWGTMTELKTVVSTARQTRADGADGISKAEYAQIKAAYAQCDGAEVKWLEKTHPHLAASLQSGLDHDGYTGTTIGSLNLTRAGDELRGDAGRRAANLDKLPPLSDYQANGMPKSVPAGDNLGKHPDNGKDVRAYQTGPNITKVVGDDLANTSDADALKSRQAQKDFATKMSGVTGLDVSNPPSVGAARAYFQGMADKGATPAELKREYGQYLQTFYKHPGGGVDWKPALDPKTIGARVQEQPLAKDGKRLVDCEGFAALTENIMGGVKAKNGQPMFDIQHSATSSHVVCGVFPRGADKREGFVVDNTQVRDLRPDSRFDALYAQSTGDETRERFLLRTYLGAQGVGTPTEYGRTYGNMHPPASK